MKGLAVVIMMLLLAFAFAGCKQQGTAKKDEKSSRPAPQPASALPSSVPEKAAPPAVKATAKSDLAGTWEYTIQKDTAAEKTKTTGKVAFKDDGSVSDEEVTEARLTLAPGKNIELTAEEEAAGKWELKKDRIYEVIDAPKIKLTKYIVAGKDFLHTSNAASFEKMLVYQNTNLHNVFQIISFNGGRLETMLIEKGKKTPVVFVKK